MSARDRLQKPIAGASPALWTAQHDTGVIAIQPSHLRIAFCSVEAADLPGLVARVKRGFGQCRASG